MGEPEIHNCLVKMRGNAPRRREKVYVGCGAGFAGDRPLAAAKLLRRVKELNYLVLECLAERTLADRYKAQLSGGNGYDPRITEWMELLLPLAMERGVCIITNMGASSPLDAQEKVLEVANSLGISVTVGVAHHFATEKEGLDPHLRNIDGISVYLGAAPIVECLEMYEPNVVITSRMADASLFLAPMVYELGWDWDEMQLLAQGSLAGHLLECGCQLTGGYFMHPGDEHRNLSFSDLLDLSLPFAEVSFDGRVILGKAEGSGGVIDFNTCAEQLLYEVGDPSAYITPDVVIDFQDVTFQSITKNKVLCAGSRPSAAPLPDKLLLLAPKDCGWKGWGEISYGGKECVKRAKAAEFLVRSWMEEAYPGVSKCIFSYIIGLDSLKVNSNDKCTPEASATEDIRLRMDGLFEEEERAMQFTMQFTALYTNGPAGGGGISTGHKKEIILERGLVGREYVRCHIGAKRSKGSEVNRPAGFANAMHAIAPKQSITTFDSTEMAWDAGVEFSSAPSHQKVPLYSIAHSRAGDKGNDLNFSIIPHFLPDIQRLKTVITPQWVRDVVAVLLSPSSYPDPGAIQARDEWLNKHVKVEIYDVRGIHSLNVVVCNILDGGVNCSRRIDRHGKTISDLILCQQVVLPEC